MNVQISSATQSRHLVPSVSKTDSSFNRIYRGLLTSLGVAFLWVSAPALAAAPPLGLVQQFGVLGSASVTAAGTAVVNGDVGSSPTPTITGAGLSVVPPFTIHPAADAVVTQAQVDATAASTNLGLQGPGSVLVAELGGVTLGPGVYSFAATANIAAGTTLTLSGAGSYVFIVPTSLTANVGSNVSFVGVDPCQVFWQVGSSATLNGVNFPGTVIAGAAGAGSVTVGSGATLAGRAVSLTASVTMPGTGQSIGGCSAPIVIPPGGTATSSKIFAPTSITAGGVSRLTIALSNNNVGVATVAVGGFTDTLPAGMVIAPTPNVTTTCGGPLPVAAAGSSTVFLPAGATIPGGAPGTCSVAVNVTAATAGVYPNQLPVLHTNFADAALPASVSLTVLALPVPTPTLSEWAMIMLAALLAIAGFAAMRRQAR